ncbi:hypothetical protein AU476_18025 [Cupriavidus sp. UYMSc13B]|nr:hypothetical protein AU476_18025 [Cupriavidus sp. UYMSc13B]
MKSHKINSVLTMFGERWTLLVLRAALQGCTRFDEFEATLRISPTTLSCRLKSLVQCGLLERRDQRCRTKPTYHPTPKSLAPLPAFMELERWAEEWWSVSDWKQIEFDIARARSEQGSLVLHRRG